MCDESGRLLDGGRLEGTECTVAVHCPFASVLHDAFGELDGMAVAGRLGNALVASGVAVDGFFDVSESGAAVKFFHWGDSCGKRR